MVESAFELRARRPSDSAVPFLWHVRQWTTSAARVFVLTKMSSCVWCGQFSPKHSEDRGKKLTSRGAAA